MIKQFAGLDSRVRCTGACVSSHSYSRRNLRTQLDGLRPRIAWIWGVLLVTGLALASAEGAAAQAPTLQAGWNQLSPASAPPGRYFDAVTYDATHGNIVLFGGITTGGTFLNDTWLWNGTWTNVTPPSGNPPARAGFAMTYDAAHGQVVLFGGRSSASGTLGDTWLWNGTTWTQANPQHSPGARNNMSMVYDAAQGNVVLFGGDVTANSGLASNDTWIWNGSDWIQQSPATVTPTRDTYSMSYDAAHGQVVMFGGTDQFGTNLSDTWIWNGSNWIQKSPSSFPSARFGQGMAYDAALGQVVLFGGIGASGDLNDTWAWDGTNWTLVSSSANPSLREAPSGMAYDPAQGQILLFGGLSSTNAPLADTWEFSPTQNFGNINVCPSGANTPAPCSVTLSLTYNVSTATTLGTPQVVTQGTAGLDFSLATGGTCTNFSGPGTCTVNVKFAPTVAGLRLGAVELFDNSGPANQLVSTPIYGVGQAPEIAFGPGTQTTEPTTGLHYNVGVALDAAGNLYIADYVAGEVVKLTPGGVQTTVLSSYTFAPGQTPAPIGVAVDGAGNLFIADLSLPYAVKLTPAGVQTTVGSGLGFPTGIAVDGAGDAFIADQNNARVVEVTPAGVQTTVPVTGLNQPWGVAVDAAGDLFIADGDSMAVPALTPQVVKFTPGGVQSTVPVTGLSRPYHLAVDAAGDLFIADFWNSRVVEFSTTGVQTTVGSGLGAPSGVTLDAAGDVFIGDQGNGQVYEVNRSQPSLNLGVVSEGFQTSDSPLSMQNIGNQTLTGSVGAVSGSNFFEDGGTSTCSVFTLSPAASCVENFYANPQTVGSISASATTSDNSLNGNPATQIIALSALSIGPAVSVSVTGSGAGSGFVQSNPTGIDCNINGGTASGNCSINYSTGLQISFEEGPTNGSTFTGWGGACASAGTNQFCTITITAATNVIANFASSGAADTVAVSLLGSGSGTVNDNLALMSCSRAGGTNSGTCSANYPVGSQVTLTATPAAGSAFMGWGSPCSGTSPTCTFMVNAPLSIGATFTQQSLGNVNVCPLGQKSPAPCSQTLALNFSIPATTTIGAIQVVTQGTTGLDFSLGDGSTCTGTILAGNTCAANVTFTPLAPGLRMGSVTLYDNNGNAVATQPVYGVGQAPLAAFGPPTRNVVNTGFATLATPNGAAVDAAGNLYIAVAGNGQIGGGAEVLKVAPNGAVTTVGSNLAYPQGLAVDGAGDLFIADNNQNEVIEVTPAGVQTAMNFGVTAQLGVAVDGAGDVFVSAFNAGQVIKAPPGCTTGACTTVVYTAPAGLHPIGLAVDGAGDLFIADFADSPAFTPGKVVEIPAGCTSTSCQTTVGTGWSQPESVAVDAAGDVFVADEVPAVVEVPAGCTSSACQITLGNMLAFGVAVDARGDVIIPDRDNNAAVDPDSNQVIVLSGSQPPSLSFALTNVGSTSTDSPQAVSVQNVGNQTLTGTVALSLGANFAQNGSSNCSAGFSLIPGAICAESFSFTPQSTGAFTGTAVFSDNTSNLSPLVVVQSVNLSGTGGLNGQAVATVVPNVVGMTQAAATAALTNAGLSLGAVSSGYSNSEPAGSVMGESPAAGTQVSPGSAVALRLSIGEAPTPAPNPLSFENNYFVTGDYATGAVTLRGKGIAGVASGTITISNSGAQGVPDGADIVDGYLYWEVLENTASPSGNTGKFLGYPITGQQVGSDLPFTDGASSGTLRVYRADVNAYFPIGANGVRFGSGNFTVSLPDSGGTGFPIAEGASLVEIYRVLSPNFPLKAVVIYDGSAIPTTATPQAIQGFYDAVGGASGMGEYTPLYYANGSWNGTPGSVALGQPNQYTASLNAGGAYAAVILSTPVNNSDKDGILDAWKTGPASGDFFFGQPGYYDVKTSSWVALPGAKHGQKDLFVQFDYMCGSVLPSGACDPTQENLYPAPDPNGNDPLVMVQNAFAQANIVLHLQVGNAVPESICTDNLSTNPPQLCQFPGESGVIGWKNSLEFSKLWPRNFASCAAGGDCTARFPYGQKDSYHYVLFGHSLAIPAWNSRYGSLTSITVASGVTTIGTTDRGNGINACPSRITISGVVGNANLNGVYNTASCPDTKTMIVSTPGVANWSYPNNTLPEPAIGIISGTVTSISGYSDLGGADSAVTLALWATAPNQDMSKRANVVAGTLFHEIGHTLALSHGGLYYDTTGSYIPTFDVNCKTNYQSSMNYLFQLDGVGPAGAVAYSNQSLATLNEGSLASVNSLTDGIGNPATFSTSAWYVPYTAGSTTASPATLHCDGTPLNGDAAYRVNGSITSNPGWSNGQNIAFDGVPYTSLRGYNDVANIDLRQVGATGGEFASLASVLSFESTATPVNIKAGGNITLGSGGTVALGSGGNITLGSGGNVTLGSGGTITPGTNGSVTVNNGGTVGMSTGGTITLGSGGNITLGSGGASVTVGVGGTITLGSGGDVTLVSGGTVTLGSGGTIALGSGGSVTIPASGGTYTLPPGGGTITLGSGGNVTLGSGGNVTLGSGGNVTLGSGGNVTLGSGGNITLGSGGTIALGSGGNITLGSGGNVTLGSGGNVTLGSGGNVTLGSGGNVTLGSGGNVTLGSGGNITLGSGGNVTLGSGGTVTLGSGGNVTLGSGGNVTLGSGGNVILGSGGNITLGSGGNVVMGSGGTVTLGSGGGTINNVQEPAGTYSVNSGGSVTFGGSGGNVTLGSGGNVTLGSGGASVSVGSGGNITLGSGGTVTLGSGGNVTLGSGGNVTLGSGGNVTLGSGGTIALGSGGNVTLGSGGVTADELTYEKANSTVRPPPSATSTQAGSNVTINWMPPVFGVVQTYTIYRGVNGGGSPMVIGSVNGVNGNPPATTFTDFNPPTGVDIKNLVYTITTTLVPDPNGSQRESVPSPPAVVTMNQTIVFGPPLPPSSVILSSGTVQIYATAESNANPNGQLVSFSTTGPCSVGGSSINSNGVSSATVTLNDTGSCVVTASQAGSTSTQAGGTSYNEAQPVSATFAIVAENSSTTPQVINFPQLPNIQYGKIFALNATDNSGMAINYNIAGPCTQNGMTTGIGTCTITATAQAGTVNNVTYSAASVSQSFTIYPAVLTVTAGNLTSPFGQIPSLTNDYTITGFVNGDGVSVLNGTSPALSTTANTSSTPAIYPISVAMGSLAATNYTFALVPGTLTIQAGSQTITFTTPAPASAPYKGTFPVAATSTSNLTVTLTVDATSTAVCSLANGVVTMNSGAGKCTIDANQAGNANYGPAAQVQSSATATPATQTISFTTPAPASATYQGTFPVAATSTSNLTVALTVDTASAVCSLSNGTVTMNSGTGTCTIDANQAGNANYSAATTVKTSATATLAAQTISFTPPTSETYGVTPITLSATSTSGLAVTFTIDGSSTTGAATLSGNVLTIKGVGTLVIDANQAGNLNYQPALQVKRTIVVNPALLTVTANSFSRPYNTANPPLTVTYSGFVNGDTSAVLNNTSPSVSTTATTASLPGTYPITVTQGTLAAANYSFKLVNGTLTVTYTGSVPPSGTACNGAYSGTFKGSLTISNGQNCVLVGGGATGSITEKGGNLSLSGGAKIGNGITVSGGTFTIGPSTTVTGSVTIQSMPTSANTNQVCGTTITGNLVFQSNATAVLIGSSAPSCAGNNVNGNLQVQSNSAATVIDRNTVGANLQDVSNSGATQVFSNIITKALQCSSNSSITGGGNTAASKSGQCAKF